LADPLLHYGLLAGVAVLCGIIAKYVEPWFDRIEYGGAIYAKPFYHR